MMKRMAAFLCLLLALLLCCGFACADGADTESLTLTGGDPVTLNDLNAYPNLRFLTLTDRPAEDLAPLAACARLTSLTIRRTDDYNGGDSYDLSPLNNCTRLHTLALIGKGIDDLSALKDIPKLSALTLENTAATDFSPVETLNLKHLRLHGADADVVTRIFTAIGGKLTSTAVGSCTLTPKACDAILSGRRLQSLSFTDAEGIDGASSRWEKLSNLTSLTITRGSVSSMAFCNSYISSAAVKLTDVFIGGAVCSVDFDKYFLRTQNVPEDALCTLLKGDGRRWQYAIVGNQGKLYSSDVITALQSLKGLLSLDIQALDLDAFSPDVWDGFADLEQLKLSSCPTVPLRMLQSVPGVVRLSVQGAAIKEAEQITRLQKLAQLSLVNCTADDWAFFDMLPGDKLTLLNLSGCNGPQSIAFVKDLERLKVLALEYAPISDLTPLAGMKLEQLSVYGCDIADYTPLTSLGSLQRLYCSEGAALPALACRIIYRGVTAAR